MENVAQDNDVAHHPDNPSATENSDRHIRENFESFSKSSEFLELPLSSLKGIISRNDLNAQNEEVVFEAVLKWIKKSPSERKPNLPDLLSEIRMTCLPYNYLIQRLTAEELLSGSDSCNALIEEVKLYNLMTKERSEMCVSFKTYPRNYQSFTHVIYAVSYAQSSGLSINSYDFINDKWIHLSSLQTAGGGLLVTAAKDKAFIFLDRSIVTFQPKSSEWEMLEAKHDRIAGVAAVTYENIIYCFGSSYQHLAEKVRRFDTLQNKWLDERKMKSSRCYPGATSLRNYIYVTGGYSDSSNRDSAEKYNPFTDEWSEISSMLTPRFGHGCVNVKDRVYVCGGFDKIAQLSSAEVYDPVTNEWNYISPMNTARQFFSLLPHNSKIYAFGGLTEGYAVTRDSEIYDPETDQWKSGLLAPEGFEFALSVPTILNENVHQSGNVPQKSPNVL